MKFSALVGKLNKLMFPTRNEIFISNLLHVDSNLRAFAEKRILVQGVQSLYYYGLFGVIANELSKSGEYKIDIFHLKSLTVSKKNIAFNFFRLLLVNVLENNKWKSLYSIFSDGVGYSSSKIMPIYDIKDFFKALKIWNELKSKDDLIKLKLDNIAIGDLIYDSYLRYKPSATVNLGDSYLLIIIWQSLREYRRSIEYFDRVKPLIYLSSYSSYLEHGIAIRVALCKQVSVYTITHYLHFCKKMSVIDTSVVKNSQNYKNEFNNLANSNLALKEAEIAINLRLNGRRDSSNAYMKKIPNRSYVDSLKNISGSIIIFLHDFFDSPHCFKSMLFNDFYEWVTYTIEFLTAENIKFCVKPHPNQMVENLDVINYLKKTYPEVVFIPDDISNRYLVAGGIVAGITVYGSIAHELGYLGVPTIACGDNPHVPFYFCKTANDLEGYKSLIKGISETPFDKNKSKVESLIFYYMHYFNLSKNMTYFLNLLGEWHRYSHDSTVGKNELQNALLKIKSSEELKAEVHNIKG